MDLKFYSHEPLEKMQNILRQHMHEKQFFILTKKRGVNP